MRDCQPERRQFLNRIEHAGQKCCRHDQEVLERGQLVELLGPDTGDHAHRTQDRRAQQREHDDPQREGERQVREPGGDDEHARAHAQAAHDRRGHVGRQDLPVRQRRQQDEHQVAGNFRLDQRGRGIGEGVLQHAHHHQARDQEGGVVDAFEHLHAAFEHVAEDQQVEHRGDDRRGDGLGGDLPEAQDLFIEQGLETHGKEIHRIETPA